MINQYPPWKYATVIAVLIIGILYSLPNIYGKRFAVVVSPRVENIEVTQKFAAEIKAILDAKKYAYQSFEQKGKRLFIYFPKSDQGQKDQREAATVLDEKYISEYVVSQALVPNTPKWLQSINGQPLSLGLDLQGGVHALMDVKLEVAIERSVTRLQKEVKTDLKDKKYKFRAVRKIKHGLSIWFAKENERSVAAALIRKNYPGFELTNTKKNKYFYLSAILSETQLDKERSAAIEKNILTLKRRVNELGVTEPVIVRQGQSRIVIQLPGIQDPEKLWAILDKEAIIRAHGVAEENTPSTRTLEYDQFVEGNSKGEKVKRVIKVKKDVIWTGENVKNASAGFASGEGDNSPAVHITLDDEGGKANSKYSSAHIGKNMAIVFIDSRPAYVMKDGKKTRVNLKYSKIISNATIQGSLYKRFEITGLDSTKEARILAILLRSGALAAPITPVETRTVGPSLGAENVDQGMNSVLIGFALVLLFMLVYYKFFGIVANIALVFNLVLLIAVLSMLQATLTLPGIAGIVLTVGMAVDANVLIYERIREELRLGNSPQASINSGYEKAFSTIADANITTFIAAVVLLGIGSGAVKGFAVTLSLGIMTSMFTAIMGTRAIVNLYYGGRKIEKMSI